MAMRTYTKAWPERVWAVEGANGATSLSAPAERGNALLKSTWRALRRITLCPWRIGNIVTAALVLPTMQRSRW